MRLKEGILFKEYQKKAIHKISPLKRGIISLPTGLGKTLTSFEIYRIHKESNKDLKMLFITDKGLVGKSKDELLKFYACVSFTHILDEGKKQRISIYQSFLNKDVLFISYSMVRADKDIVSRMVNTLGDNVMIVFDEVAHLKSTTSQVSKICKVLVKNVGYCYGLTATPTKGRLEHFYRLLEVLQLTKYSFDTFLQLYADVERGVAVTLKHQNRSYKAISNNQKKEMIFMFDLVELGIIPRYHSYDILKFHSLFVGSSKLPDYINRISFKDNLMFLHFSYSVYQSLNSMGHLNPLINLIMDNVGELKKVSKYVNRWFKTSIVVHKHIVGYKNIPKFRADYEDVCFFAFKEGLPPFYHTFITVPLTKEVFDDIALCYEFYSKTIFNKMSISTCCYLNEYEELKVTIKYDKLLELLCENMGTNGKSIIYSSYTTVIELYEKLLKKDLPKLNIASYTGKLSLREREEIRLDFESNKIDILFISDAGSHGLDMQNASCIYFLNLPITGGEYIQIAGRISRIGSTNKRLDLYYLITDKTVDVDIYELIRQQVQVINAFGEELLDEGLIKIPDSNSGIVLSKKELSNEGEYFLRRLTNRKKFFSGKYRVC